MQGTIICYEPIKGRIPDGVFAPQACHGIIVETLNAVLPVPYRRLYKLRRFIQPYRDLREDYSVQDKNNPQHKIPAERWHFFYIITPSWILNYLPPSEFKILSKGDWEKVRMLTEVARNPPSEESDITVLYDFDYYVLNKLWGIQRVLIPA